MLKFKFELLTVAALAISLAPLGPAEAAKSADGMAVKVVSARKYRGNGAKQVAQKISRKSKIVKKSEPAAPKLTSNKMDRPASDEITQLENHEVVVNAAKSAPIEKMKPIAKSATPTVSKAKANAIAAANGQSSGPSKQRPPSSRPMPNRPSSGTISATTQPARTMIVAEDSPIAEKDLTETLDRLPVMETATAPAPATQMLRTRVAAPATAEKPMFSPVIQLKNRLTTGRKYELEEIGGKNFSRKHEVVLGAKHSSGFGASLTGSISGSSFDDNAKDKQTTNDITMLLYHPGFYKNDGWDFYGFGRVFFPTSEASKPNNRTHYLYVFGTNFDFGGGFRLENSIVPHYFTQDTFADDDTFFLLEEELIAKYDLVPWLTLGIGPYVQIDSHERSAPGTSAEITPILGFNINDHIYFESKAYLPIYTDGQVGGGPRRAALSEIAGEFYLKIWL